MTMRNWLECFQCMKRSGRQQIPFVAAFLRREETQVCHSFSLLLHSRSSTNLYTKWEALSLKKRIHEEKNRFAWLSNKINSRSNVTIEKLFTVSPHSGKSPLFIQKFPRIWCLKKCEFCEKGVINMSNVIFTKREFCEKWGLQNVNFVKNEI